MIFPPGTNVKELAAYFGTIFRGMAVQARDGASRKQLLAICRVAMRAWPSRPPDSNHKTDHKGRPRGRDLLTSIYRSSRGYRNEGLAFVLFCGLHLEMRNPEIVR